MSRQPLKIERAQFLTLLRQRFPEVAGMIDDCSDGLLHLEVGTLGRATRDAIRGGDAATVRAHFEFVDQLYANAAPELENALNVSYLEHIDLDGRKARSISARDLLTPRLRGAAQKCLAFKAASRRSADA